MRTCLSKWLTEERQGLRHVLNSRTGEAYNVLSYLRKQGALEAKAFTNSTKLIPDFDMAYII